jgi:hypothetical protein
MTIFEDDFIKQYREKIEQIKCDRRTISELEKEIYTLQEKVNTAEQERNVMRRMITRMVDEGIDSVDSRLQGDQPWNSNLWYEEPPAVGQGTTAGMLGQSGVMIPTINVPLSGDIYPTTVLRSMPTVWSAITKYIGI